MTTPTTTTAGRYAPDPAPLEQQYEHEDTRALVALVNSAAELLAANGEDAFADFRAPGSRWRRPDAYVFVLNPHGDMLVHPDPVLEGSYQLHLKDVAGRPVIAGVIAAAMAVPGKPEGWHHYQWPGGDGLLPRWRSAYSRLVETATGKQFVVGSIMSNDRMERAFVVDLVRRAVYEIEQRGKGAFRLFRDPIGPFMAKDAYVFVNDMTGTSLVHPAFPNLEGRNLIDLRDSGRKAFIHDMVSEVQAHGSGWVDYMWPKPGESAPTQKSTFVCGAMFGETPVMVGCGVYLADAPRGQRTTKMTASEAMALVREAAAGLEKQGRKMFAEFQERDSRWFHDDIYFFVWALDGTRVFNAADPTRLGRNESAMRDALGKPVGRMILEAGTSAAGEGWIHYMYPKPGDVYPSWKSSFVKRVTFPSGTQHIVGCGVYDMQMDEAFIEDVVDRAATLIAERGPSAFPLLRDRTGPFVFMDTYVFVERADGTELVNAAQPSLEGKNLMELRDVTGKAVVAEEIDAALEKGSAWLECHWFKPGDGRPARKKTYVRRVETAHETYIVGSGIYVE